MKLYYKPGACSLASHIILEESGATFELEKVNTQTKLTESNADYLKINPRGYVPALAISEHQVLTEGPAILQYLADKFSIKNLLPSVGSLERIQVIESLTYTSSELHNAFGPLFRENSDSVKENAKLNIANKFDYLEAELSDSRSFIAANQFSIADAYLFVVCNWSNFVGIDLQRWPKLSNYLSQISERDSVQRAMRTEGLI